MSSGLTRRLLELEEEYAREHPVRIRLVWIEEPGESGTPELFQDPATKSPG